MTTAAETLAAGLKLYQQGDLAAAEQIYRQVLAADPGNADSLHLLGLVALDRSHNTEAIKLIENSLRLQPNVPYRLVNLAVANNAAERFDEALQALDRALALDPQLKPAYRFRGDILHQLGRFDEAVTAYRQLLQIHPQHFAVLASLAEVLRDLGRLEESLATFDQALAIAPAAPDARFKRSLVLLGQGRLQEGFAEYDWRLCYGAGLREMDSPRWDGRPLPDGTLLVVTEQGLGDTLQFIRYLPLIRARVRQVFVEVPERLIPLLAQSGCENLIAAGSPLPHCDAHLSLLSAPHVLGTTLETIPAHVPYLWADEQLVERWRKRLAPHEGLRVGIAWQGSPTYRDDRLRSIPLAAFAPLAEVPGVQLISLQKGPGIEQIPPIQASFCVVNLGSEFDEAAGVFQDTAAILKNLDLVVTADTACAHLAGALGVPTWVALRLSPDWRWLAGRSDSPWYPTLRLFRQQTPGDWSAVFRAMAEQLHDGNLAHLNHAAP